jgi:hypothetical protein
MLNLLIIPCDRYGNACAESSRLAVSAAALQCSKQAISRRLRGLSKTWERVRRLFADSSGQAGAHPAGQVDSTTRENFWEELRAGQREAETRARR